MQLLKSGQHMPGHTHKSASCVKAWSASSKAADRGSACVRVSISAPRWQGGRRLGRGARATGTGGAQRRRGGRRSPPASPGDAARCCRTVKGALHPAHLSSAEVCTSVVGACCACLLITIPKNHTAAAGAARGRWRCGAAPRRRADLVVCLVQGMVDAAQAFSPLPLQGVNLVMEPAEVSIFVSSAASTSVRVLAVLSLALATPLYRTLSIRAETGSSLWRS